MRELIIHNFAPLIGVILLITIIFEDGQLLKLRKHTFLITTALFVLSLFARNAEIITSEYDYYTPRRALWSALLYIFRAAILYTVIETELNVQKRNNWLYLVLAIPLFAMAFIGFSVFFTDKFYYFTDDNHFGTGPWGLWRYVPLLVYFIILLVIIMREAFRKHRIITILGFECLALILAAMAVEYFNLQDFMCETAIILALVFYYMYFQTNFLLLQNSNLLVKAHMDGLTGVYNRTGYDAVLHANQNTWKDVGFLIMDIDRFKTVNDTYGHEIGDEILKRVAEILRSTFRSTDIIVRFGGDEFVVLLPGLSADMGQSIANKVESMNVALENPIRDLPKVTLSCGLAFSKTGVDTDLYQRADKKLYEIKSTTRRGCAVDLN